MFLVNFLIFVKNASNTYKKLHGKKEIIFPIYSLKCLLIRSLTYSVFFLSHFLRHSHQNPSPPPFSFVFNLLIAVPAAFKKWFYQFVFIPRFSNSSFPFPSKVKPLLLHLFLLNSIPKKNILLSAPHTYIFFWLFKMRKKTKISDGSPKLNASFFSRLFYSWFGPILQIGRKRPLTEHDLFELDTDNKCHFLTAQWEKLWLPAAES